MVKSTSSCFKIITCGSDSVDKDDLEPIESKRSTDKRGWSFRKRSARHRVLSNTVIAESPATGNRESPESTNINYHAQTTVPEKISVSHWTNEYPLSSVANSNAPDPLSCTKNSCKIDPVISTEGAQKTDPLISKENFEKVDHNLEESSALVIQTAIRRYLAQRTLLKVKNVIKLQAAVRGHLVRSQAVGTLRCVQAITKMQALVRARRARLSLQGLAIEEKPDGNERHSSVKPLGKENSGTQASRTSSSTEKLLSNAFARQLMQSTPKKQIHIKCDPSRPDSAWKWLDRWMSVSSSNLVEPDQPHFTPEHKEQEETFEDTASELGTEISAEVGSASKDMKSSSKNAATSIDNEEKLITYDADKFVFQACRPTSSSTNDMQRPFHDDLGSSNARVSSSTIDTTQSEMLSTAPSQTQPRSISNKPVAVGEQPKRSMKRVASEQPETESKKPVFGSRKTTNPAFVAVQSKFEGLSSSATSRRSISSTSQDVGVESKLDSLHSSADSLTKTKESSQTENPISHETRVRVGGSECGSLLSITSTLDSPDRSEVEGIDFEQEPEYVEKVRTKLNLTTDDASRIGNLDVEPKTDITAQPNSSSPASIQQESIEDVNGETVDLVLAVDPWKEERQPERSASNVPCQLDTVTEQQGYRSSPEGSPRSHVTIPESHGTPSSQVSVNAKRSKLDKSGGTQSRKYQTSGKRSPSNQNLDSGGRSSTEQLSKDPKNGKRRNSFGSSKSNHLDQEPRDSSSSNSLPSYMQATESARAKANALASPRSSPDVQDKDIYLKKRHSLPGTNGKQGSPRMQRSMSQALQGAKGNGTQSPHEKKWVR